jgi:N-acetylglutamate synthase-like GNAT family acetyltransferase
MAIIRDYSSDDEQGWLRCRILAFMSTAYFDDVATSKPEVSGGAELVAEQGGVIVGVLDLVVDGDLATIETVAVHPDFQRDGVGSSLLGYGMERAGSLGAKSVDAWTRDDEATLAWYRARGFAEDSHYLHVYADSYVDPQEPGRAVRPHLA